jgi:hypothetical protein
MHGHGEKPYLCTHDGCERAVPGHGFPRQWNLRDHMRRVHNDNSPATAPMSPPAGSSSASGRGRKRKTDVPEKAVAQEKASTRKSSKSSADAAAKAAKQQAMNHVDQWHKHHKALQELVYGFGQPADPAFLQSIAGAQTHLAAMEKITHSLMATSDSSRAQARSWKQSG